VRQLSSSTVLYRELSQLAHRRKLGPYGETFALETNRDITKRKRAEEQLRVRGGYRRPELAATATKELQRTPRG